MSQYSPLAQSQLEVQRISPSSVQVPAVAPVSMTQTPQAPQSSSVMQSASMQTPNSSPSLMKMHS